MSGRSCASGDSCRGSGRTHELVLDALYDRKRDKKTVRVLTVVVYVFCVSLAAIMLSLYYVFFWEPKDAHHAQPKVSHTLEPPLTPTCFMPHTGRSNTSVSDTSATIANSTAYPANATLITEATSAKTAESSDDGDAVFNNSYFDEAADNSTTVQDVT